MNLWCNFRVLMRVNEWTSQKCSDAEPCIQDISYQSTRSHLSKGECGTRRLKACSNWPHLKLFYHVRKVDTG